MFVNTVVLRTDLANNPSFLELIGRVRKVILDAFRHPDTPFDILVQEFALALDTSRTPIFKRSSRSTSAEPRLAFRQSLLFADQRPAAIHADGSLFVGRTNGRGCPRGLDYSTDLFDEETIARFLEELRHLLASACKDPTQTVDRVPIIPVAESRSLREVNATEPHTPRSRHPPARRKSMPRTFLPRSRSSTQAKR